jgi:hypothetical protein
VAAQQQFVEAVQAGHGQTTEEAEVVQETAEAEVGRYLQVQDLSPENIELTFLLIKSTK